MYVLCPAGPFSVFKPQNQEIGELCVVEERLTAVFVAAKLRKSRSGSSKETNSVVLQLISVANVY